MRVATAVVGAGPAGLLFCIASRVLAARSGREPDPLRLFDKRAGYERTHRLRMDPAPYRALAADLRHPEVDGVLAFLESERFRPAVNTLEERLLAAAAALGVRRERLAVGPGSGETDLDGLRRKIEADGLAPDGWLAVVGADSVHSAVRDLLGAGPPVEHTHHAVARLRVEGAGLPEALGVVQQLKLSKVIASIVDYRRNPNGFGEMDLFLGASEHAALAALGATPRQPVLLDDETLGRVRAPLFRRLVEQVRRGFGDGPCAVTLQSLFRLEHRAARRLVVDLPDRRIRGFLVGDAAVSLPFFRGMACLGACVASLAHAHRDWADRILHPPPDAPARALLASERRVFGGQPLPGVVVRAEATVHRGAPAVVAVHRWLWRWGTHVWVRGEGGAWVHVHRLAPVGRARAIADAEAHADPGLRYAAEADAIRRREIAVVGARAWLVRGARDFLRLNAVLPFPMQTWLLSVPAPTAPPAGWTLGAVGNLGLAGLAAGAALLAPVLAVLAVPGSVVAWAGAVVLQGLGGVAYAAAHSFEGGPHARVRAVWRWQIVALLVGGAGVAVGAATIRPATVAAATAWFWMAAPFVAGLSSWHALDRRWWERAALLDA